MRQRERVVPVLPTVPGQEGVLPIAEDTFEGSYVAVSKPGKGAVHIINGKGGYPQTRPGPGINRTLNWIDNLIAYEKWCFSLNKVWVKKNETSSKIDHL